MGFALAITVIMSVIAYLAFAHDKAQAQSGGWRVSEGTLLLLAFFARWPGAKLAQHTYRHKTRKEPFRTQLNIIGLCHGTVVALMVMMPDQRLGEVLEQTLVATIISGPDAIPFLGSDDSMTAQNPMPRRFGPGSADW